MEGGVPLHPALVHLPIGLAIILPFFFAVFLFMIYRGKMEAKQWWIPVILQLVLVFASFAALRSGESEEEHVEKAVPEAALEEHEEVAHYFFYLILITFLVSAGALKDTKVAGLLRSGAVVLSLATLGTGLYAGKLGGELVFKHGAADVYSKRQEGASPAIRGESNEGDCTIEAVEREEECDKD